MTWHHMPNQMLLRNTIEVCWHSYDNWFDIDFPCHMILDMLWYYGFPYNVIVSEIRIISNVWYKTWYNHYSQNYIIVNHEIMVAQGSRCDWTKVFKSHGNSCLECPNSFCFNWFNLQQSFYCGFQWTMTTRRLIMFYHHDPLSSRLRLMLW